MSEATEYRRKSVEVVQAIQWSGSNWHQMLSWIKWEHETEVWQDEGSLRIRHDGYEVRALPGEWVVFGSSGVFSVYNAQVFEQIYEKNETPGIPADYADSAE